MPPFRWISIKRNTFHTDNHYANHPFVFTFQQVKCDLNAWHVAATKRQAFLGSFSEHKLNEAFYSIQKSINTDLLKTQIIINYQKLNPLYKVSFDVTILYCWLLRFSSILSFKASQLITDVYLHLGFISRDKSPPFKSILNNMVRYCFILIHLTNSVSIF